MEDRGFVRLQCPKCGRADQWLRCEKCGKSDHFLLAGGAVGCDCGASYDHGRCACGERVPGTALVAVAWQDGPRQLADLEIAWGRVAALGVVAVVGIGAVAWWALA